MNVVVAGAATCVEPRAVPKVVPLHVPHSTMMWERSVSTLPSVFCVGFTHVTRTFAACTVGDASSATNRSKPLLVNFAFLLIENVIALQVHTEAAGTSRAFLEGLHRLQEL